MNNLKRIMEILNIKKSDLAKYLNTSHQNVDNILKTKNPQKHIEEIAKYLNIDIEFLSKRILTKDDEEIIILQHNNELINDKPINMYIIVICCEDKLSNKKETIYFQINTRFQDIAKRKAKQKIWELMDNNPNKNYDLEKILWKNKIEEII